MRLERLASPPVVFTAMVPLVTDTGYGPSTCHDPAEPLTTFDATVAPLITTPKFWVALSSHTCRLTR